MSSDPDYVAWDTSPLGGFATLLPLENVPDRYELSEGVSRADGFPADAAFRMDPSHKKSRKVADAMGSRAGAGVPIVSSAIREIMASFDPPQTEFLPVTIYDHSGEVASDTHVIAHPCLVIDCLDHDAMGVVYNPLDPTAIMFCARVALDADKIDGAPAMFRAKGLARVLVRRDLADALSASGLTGMYFYELADVTN